MLEVTIHYPVATRMIDEPSGDKVRIQFVLPKRPFLFWADRVVCESLKLPRGYGVAWYDCTTTRILFAPMPFNVLVGVCIELWLLVRYGVAYKLLRLNKRLLRGRN